MPRGLYLKMPKTNAEQQGALHQTATALVSPTPTAEPAVVAARDTANYTFDLAAITFILAVATVASVIASIVLQNRANFRDDRLRQAASTEAERVRREQYTFTERLRQNELDESRAAEQRAHYAARQQMLTILKATEVYMNLLVAMPQYPIAGETETATLLFNRAFSSDITQAIDPDVRPAVYDALIKSQETLQATLVQQRMRAEMLSELERDSEDAAAFTEELHAAHEYAKQMNRREDHIELARLQSSVRAYDARKWVETHESRNEKIEAIFPTIEANAKTAKAALAAARKLLGDDSGPLPELQRPS